MKRIFYFFLAALMALAVSCDELGSGSLWKLLQSGTYHYQADKDGGTVLFKDIKTTSMYLDKNHPDIYKISPWGQDGKYELMITLDEKRMFRVVPQVVGKTSDGKDIIVADAGTDQSDSESGSIGYSEEEKCWYFNLVYREGDRNGKVLWKGEETFTVK